MRRLFLTVLALVVSASAGSASSVILPARCVPTATGGEAQPGPLTAYKILGERQHRSYTICARNRGGQCRTIELHRFDIQCGNARVPLQNVAQSIIRQRGIQAKIASGRLRFRLGNKPFAALNVLCGPAKERSTADRLAVRRWNLDAECKQRSVVPRDVIELPSGFAPLAALGGQIVAGYQANSGLLAAISTANAKEYRGRPAPAAKPAAAVSPRPLTSTAVRPAESTGERARATAVTDEPRSVAKAAMTLPGEALAEGEAKPEPKRALLPRFASRAIEVPLPKPTVAPSKAAGAKPSTPPRTAPAPPPLPAVRVAAAGKAAVTTSDANSWNTLVEVVSRQNSGDAAVRQQVQHSMVATILGLALVTSLVSGIGWFATQQFLGARNRNKDPYQVILRREVVDLAKPDAQMCGELCRTGQGLIGEINTRVDEIKGAAPLRRVLLREVRSMEQFLSTTIQTAPDDPKEWRRMRLRLQRVVTDLIRLKDITDGARRSLTTKIISDELPRDKQEAYEVLGANPEASEKILKRLVDALRATWHPDLASTDDDRELRDRRIKQINVAWDLITEKRVEA